MSYFCKIIELYFKDFVQKTTIEVVNLTRARYPISEKEFIKKYSHLIEYIIKEKKRVLNGSENIDDNSFNGNLDLKN